jgi:hypothetical protein
VLPDSTPLSTRTTAVFLLTLLLSPGAAVVAPAPLLFAEEAEVEPPGIPADAPADTTPDDSTAAGISKRCRVPVDGSQSDAGSSA